MENITALQILDALEEQYSHRGWIFFRELRTGTGYGAFREQRVDAWAINSWPSSRGSDKLKTPLLRRVFEVKVNASDALKELRNPDKRWYPYALSHEFYFVTPPGLIDKKLLSKDDGLIEYHGNSAKQPFHTVKAPRTREAMPPRWDFVSAIARRSKEWEQFKFSEITHGLREQIADMHQLIQTMQTLRPVYVNRPVWPGTVEYLGQFSGPAIEPAYQACDLISKFVESIPDIAVNEDSSIVELCWYEEGIEASIEQENDEENEWKVWWFHKKNHHYQQTQATGLDDPPPAWVFAFLTKE